MNNFFVLTADNSYTLYNKNFDEHYHSITGAYEEALKKYFEPLEIEDDMTILDFCFGLGYNSFTAISLRKNLKITALENDIEVIKKIYDFPYPKNLQQTVQNFISLYRYDTLRDDKNNEIKLILKDASISIKELNSGQFDRIFFDPFSPSKIPKLWTKEIFDNLYKLLKVGGKLSTYSCAKKIRANMIDAGFKVIDGPSIGRKSPSTIAIKE